MHRFPVSLCLLLACPLLCVALLPTKLIYEYPNQTWCENLVVRPSGSILVTSLTHNDVWLIDPHAPNPESILIHQFTDAWVTGGITETTPDTFYVAVANFTIAKMEPAPPGSVRIFRISFPSQDSPLGAQVSLAATLDDALLVNGLTTFNTTHVLAADTLKGVVWAVNVLNGDSSILMSDPMMGNQEGSPYPGLNGLKIYGDTLYFTNSYKRIFGKIKMNPNGTAVGKAEQVVQTNTTDFDDFAINSQGEAFLVNGPSDTISTVDTNGGLTVIAGQLGSTEIAEPTAAQFGRTLLDNDILYVTTAGGLGSPINRTQIIGGQLVAVYTGSMAQTDYKSDNGRTQRSSAQHPLTLPKDSEGEMGDSSPPGALREPSDVNAGSISAMLRLFSFFSLTSPGAVGKSTA